MASTNRDIHFELFRRFWLKKKIQFVIYFLAWVVPVMFFVGYMTGDTLAQRLLVIATVSVGILVFFYILGKARRSNVGDSEFAALEDRFEEEADALIIAAFGEQTYSVLVQEEFNQINSDAAQGYSILLHRPEVAGNETLRFHMLVKRAKFLIKDDQYEEAVRCLRDALNIKPNDLVANIRTAIALERNGNGDGAVKHYENGLNSQSIHTPHLRKWISLQIERVKKKGPRRKPLLDGLRWMS